jgi:hypothetical protein
MTLKIVQSRYMYVWQCIQLSQLVLTLIKAQLIAPVAFPASVASADVCESLLNSGKNGNIRGPADTHSRN